MFLPRPLPAAFLLLSLAGAAAAAGADPQRSSRLTGSVSDASGAVLPGVTVTATALDTDVSQTTMTDGAGRYELAEIPPATYVVSFVLDGFRPAEEAGIVVGGHEVVRDRTLDLDSLEETVTIVGAAPPARLNQVVATRRRVPDLQPLTADPPLTVCGPRQATPGAVAAARIVRLHGDAQRFLLGDRDVIVLDAGEAHAMRPGQNLVVRRRFALPDVAPDDPLIRPERTAALIQVVAVEPHQSLARVVYACAEIAVGDDVSPFEAQHATASGEGVPDFDDPARVLFADAGRTIGAPADFMVIDRGRNQGAQPGQRLTVFRRTPEGTLTRVGEGTVVSVQDDAATIHIESARDVIELTDGVALHR